MDKATERFQFSMEKFRPEDGTPMKHVSDASGLSWPGARKLLYGVPTQPEEPSIVHVVALLEGLGVQWERVMLGELVSPK